MARKRITTTWTTVPLATSHARSTITPRYVSAWMHATGQCPQRLSSLACVHARATRVQTVTDVSFHPTAPLLASCSKDMSIKFFDYSKTHAKRSVKHIQVHLAPPRCTIHTRTSPELRARVCVRSCVCGTGCGTTPISRLPSVRRFPVGLGQGHANSTLRHTNTAGIHRPQCW
jgi:WD40 repeat protein